MPSSGTVLEVFASTGGFTFAADINFGKYGAICAVDLTCDASNPAAFFNFPILPNAAGFVPNPFIRFGASLMSWAALGMAIAKLKRAAPT